MAYEPQQPSGGVGNGVPITEAEHAWLNAQLDQTEPFVDSSTPLSCGAGVWKCPVPAIEIRITPFLPIGWDANQYQAGASWTGLTDGHPSHCAACGGSGIGSRFPSSTQQPYVMVEHRYGQQPQQRSFYPLAPTPQPQPQAPPPFQPTPFESPSVSMPSVSTWDDWSNGETKPCDPFVPSEGQQRGNDGDDDDEIYPIVAKRVLEMAFAYQNALADASNETGALPLWIDPRWFQEDGSGGGLCLRHAAETIETRGISVGGLKTLVLNGHAARSALTPTHLHVTHDRTLNSFRMSPLFREAAFVCQVVEPQPSDQVADPSARRAWSSAGLLIRFAGFRSIEDYAATIESVQPMQRPIMNNAWQQHLSCWWCFPTLLHWCAHLKYKGRSTTAFTAPTELRWYVMQFHQRTTTHNNVGVNDLADDATVLSLMTTLMPVLEHVSPRNARHVLKRMVEMQTWNAASAAEVFDRMADLEHALLSFLAPSQSPALDGVHRASLEQYMDSIGISAAHAARASASSSSSSSAALSSSSSADEGQGAARRRRARGGAGRNGSASQGHQQQQQQQQPLRLLRRPTAAEIDGAAAAGPACESSSCGGPEEDCCVTTSAATDEQARGSAPEREKRRRPSRRSQQNRARAKALLLQSAARDTEPAANRSAHGEARTEQQNGGRGGPGGGRGGAFKLGEALSTAKTHAARARPTQAERRARENAPKPTTTTTASETAAPAQVGSPPRIRTEGCTYADVVAAKSVATKHAAAAATAASQQEASCAPDASAAAATALSETPTAPALAAAASGASS